MTIKDTDLRDFANAKIKIAREEIKKWELFLEALGNQPKDDSQLSLLSQTPKLTPLRTERKKLSILDKVKSVLTDADCPLTTRDIMQSINLTFPDRIYTMESFSGAFSLVYRKPEAKIKQFNVAQPNTVVKALYGLNEWFDETGNFKKEYEAKVLERYKTI